jgi:hypothetical protein
MRAATGWALLAKLALCGCGHSGLASDAASDSETSDASQTCQPTKLLIGGMDVVAQGWIVVTQGPATLSNGADFTQLQTSTTGGAASGGQLLLTHTVTIEPSKPFKLEIEMMVERTDAHNPLDAPAAILGAFTAPFGTPGERAQMIYLQGDEIGWADDTDQISLVLTDGAYHGYSLAVDGSGNAELSVDGTRRLSRVNFLLDGTIAVGDQTNDAMRDSALRIRSVTIPCP